VGILASVIRAPRILAIENAISELYCGALGAAFRAKLAEQTAALLARQKAATAWTNSQAIVECW